MDASRFDRLTRSLAVARSRRSVLSLATAVGLAATGLPRAMSAKKKHKSNNLKRNAYGCLDVGQACRGNSDNCCSGICQGKKPKKGRKDTSSCVAHHVGGCEAGQDFCATGTFLCGAATGTCFRTTGNAGFCGIDGPCQVCRKDADCEVDWGPGTACVVCAGCVDHGGTQCVMAFT